MGSVKRVFQLAVLIGFIFAMSSQAMADWVSCTVTLVGPSSGSIYVRATEAVTTPRFTDMWFVVNPAYANQQLATLLTGLSSGRSVMMNVTPIASLSIVDGVYLQ